MPDSTKKSLIFYGIKYYPSKGGTSRVAENIIRNIYSQFNIIIYCYRHHSAKNYIPEVKSIQFPELPFKGLGVFIYYFLTALHLLFFIDRKSIIHAHKIDCAFFLPLLRLKFKKIIGTSHESPYHRDKWGRIGKTYFHIAEWMFIHFTSIPTSISKPLADFYYKKFYRKVHFIPNGINFDHELDIDSAESLLRKLDINEKYLMFASRRIMSTKGLHTLFEALNILDLRSPVIVAGDEWHAQKYVNQLKEKYKHLNLYYTGYIYLPVLLALVSKAELFVFPSEIEGMSIMLLEVVSVGTPVICSDIPENTQVFSGEEVLYFKNKDAEDLSKKIRFALNNPEMMKTFTVNSKEKIINHYSWKQISRQYQELYTQ